MKKWVSVILGAMLLSLACVPAFAADMTSLELFTKWENSGYPGYVTGVFYNTETGALAFILKENTPERQDEIKAQISDSDKITFYEGKYSHAELEAACAAIRVELTSAGTDTDSGLLGVGIGWSAVSGGFGENGKDFRVVVDAKDENVEQLRDKYAAQYGDMVAVDASGAVQAVQDAAASDTAASQTETDAQAKSGISNWGIIGIVGVALIGLVFGFGRFRKSHPKTPKDNNGGHLSL